MTDIVFAPSDSTEALERVNDALRGPVTEICQNLVAQLRPLSRSEAFNRIMNNPLLAAECFREFRRRPMMFRPVLLDESGQMIASDDGRLACGKTLAEIISLIVRAVAKRHFRAKLDQQRRQTPRPPARAPGLWAAILRLFRPEPPPPPPRRKEASRANALYDAIKEFLLFDWQVGLIPSYARMPVPLVRMLGARILEFREIDAIEALIASKNIPPPINGATPVVTASPWTDDASTAAPPQATPTPLLTAPPTGAANVRKTQLETVLQSVNPAVARRLSTDLGLSNRQIAVCFIRAHDVLSSDDFLLFVRSRPGSDDIERFVASAREAGLSKDTDLAGCASFINEFFGSA